MKTGFAIVLLSATVIGGVAYAAGGAEAHQDVFVTEIAWKAAPASLPMGAQAAILFGDPGRPGSFVLRLKLPKGFRIAPHTHPDSEIVTVISGAVNMTTGGRTRRMPAGSFFAIAQGSVHQASFDEETVIQINGTGPWGLAYVDPKDDPRQRAQ